MKREVSKDIEWVRRDLSKLNEIIVGTGKGKKLFQVGYVSQRNSMKRV